MSSSSSSSSTGAAAAFGAAGAGVEPILFKRDSNSAKRAVRFLSSAFNAAFSASTESIRATKLFSGSLAIASLMLLRVSWILLTKLLEETGAADLALTGAAGLASPDRFLAKKV